MTIKMILSRIKNNASSIYVRYQNQTVPLMSVPAPVAVGYILEWLCNDIEEMEKGQTMKTFYQLNEEEQNRARKIIGRLFQLPSDSPEVVEFSKTAWFPTIKDHVVYGLWEKGSSEQS